jgi:hypothetical protein
MIAPGAQNVDFVADQAYAVTPLVQGFADLLNEVTDRSRWHQHIETAYFYDGPSKT